MSYFDAIVLGLVQGLTEFLPVSSSGHRVMAQTFLGVPSPGVFLEVALPMPPVARKGPRRGGLPQVFHGR